MPYDLTTPSDVLAYLNHLPSFQATQATPITGGTANFVYRIALSTPYRGLHTTVILKHAESYAASIPSLPLATSRFAFENFALDIIRHQTSLVSDESLIRVPEVYHYDSDYHVMILQDAGDLPTLKSFIASQSDSALATQIGSALGRFIAQLHAWGRENNRFKAQFINQGGRELCAWRTFGRLAETGKTFQFEDPEDKLELVEKAMSKEFLESEETFTMGDFCCNENQAVILRDTVRVY